MVAMFRALTLLLITVFQFVHASQINDARCASCHENEAIRWETSDHSKAMDFAKLSTVLGDFDDVVAQHFSQSALFFEQDGNYFVSLEENNTTTQYQVVYVFGHYPLQQYLVETEQGEFQVLPFAWDSRSKLDGGQRWYANY
jgi:hypothetical protein